MKDFVIDPIFPNCPVRNVLSRLSGKWPLLVLLVLDGNNRSMRFKELERAIPDISQKMLTSTLRSLEADGIVVRRNYAEVPPRVEYELTERGHSLMPHLHQLVDWAYDNLHEIIQSREEYTGLDANGR